MNLYKKFRKEFVCAAIAATSLTACGQPKPVTYESLVWVNKFYIEHPVATLNATAGGWLFRGAKEVGMDIRIGFLIPEPMMSDLERRKAVLNSICPARNEPIWQFLNEENFLVIDVWTEDNKFKDSTIC